MVMQEAALLINRHIGFYLLYLSLCVAQQCSPQNSAYEQRYLPLAITVFTIVTAIVRLCWNVSEWQWRNRREGEEGQQAGCAEMRLLCETGKCGECPATYNWLTLCLNKKQHVETIMWCVLFFPEKKLEEAFLHPEWQRCQLLQVWDGETYFLLSCLELVCRSDCALCLAMSELCSWLSPG